MIRRPTPQRSPHVLIIGAGFSGIAAAVALRRRGIEDFVIAEKFPWLGGTWWTNRYPGAEVDLESHIYSFCFRRYDWSRTHARWYEILKYLETVAREWDLLGRTRFNEKIEAIEWSEEEGGYRVTTQSGALDGTFTAVVSAVGFLSVPRIPDFAKGDLPFEGSIFHTSSWPDGVTMDDRNVAVLGTGSSAVQVVTEAEKTAREVTIFQKEPNWILPKGARDFSKLERWINRIPFVYRLRRWALYARYDLRQLGGGHARPTGRAHRKRHAAAVRFLEASLGDRPELMELATPNFPFEGRRTVISDDYYQALRNPKVHLVPHAAAELTQNGVIDATGEEHKANLVVLATGFDAANYVSSCRVVGECGRDLQQVWQGEPEAYLGMMVPGFPNFFMMYGPNTNSIPLVSFYEGQAEFVATVLSRLKRDGNTRVGVPEQEFRSFNDWLQDQLSRTVWTKTQSYFTANTGKVVSQWPFTATGYILRTKLARRRLSYR